MYRGTTPSLTFNVSIDTDNIKELYITIKSMKDPDPKKEITKTFRDCEVGFGSIIAHLTQAETLLFSAKEKVNIQLRVLTKDDSAYASKIFTVEMGEILKDGVI